MLQNIINLIADELNVDQNNIKAETRLKEDLNIDSLDVIELLMKLEEEYGIEIPDDAAKNFEVVGDIGKYVEGQMKS